MLTGQGNQELAVEAMKRGASDYLIKVRLDRTTLVRAIAGAIERESLRRELIARQAALVESEARKTAVMEAALDAIVLMDVHGAIVDFNAAAESAFGYSRAEVIGRSVAEVLVPPPLREAHASGLERYLRTGEERVIGKRLQLPARRKDGTQFAAEVAVVRIRTSGPALFTAYIRDVTDRQRAEEADALRLSKQAVEQVNAELEAFSYAVAHDLRAPLRAISGFSAALAEDLQLAPGDDCARHLERITAAASHMGHLIDGLLSLSQTARSELCMADVDLGAHARRAMEQLRESEPGREVEFTVEGSLTAHGDARLLGALLQNLLANAWKFSSKKPRTVIVFGAEETADGRAFFVRDNGDGFDMAYAEKLFVPFQRLHRASEFSGTGIGLATVDRIIRRHGGRVWAEGRPALGATFFFSLPIKT
jgi:PAS domain S-box-containing protein